MAKPRGLPVEKVRAEIGIKITAMDEIISECEARFGKNVMLLDHLILGPLTGAQWRKFHLVHGRHHVKQILQLRAFGKQKRRELNGRARVLQMDFYSRMAAGTPALRASSCMSSSFCLESLTAFCLSAIFCL